MAIAAIAFPLLAFAGLRFMGWGTAADPGEVPGVPPVEAPALPREPLLIETSDSFRKNQTIIDALFQHGLSNQEMHEIVESTRPVYNLAKIRAGGSYSINRLENGEFRDFRYSVDDDRYLTVYRNNGRYVPVMKNFAYNTAVEAVSGTITGSLFGAVGSVGESDQLALDLADIFMWDIDFYTDIQRGDSFRLLVEKNTSTAVFADTGQSVQRRSRFRERPIRVTGSRMEMLPRDIMLPTERRSGSHF